jgi:type I restriction enzyme S subunit
MRKLASISALCEVNPTLPADLRGQKGLPVSFVPMSAVRESGTLSGVEERLLGDVLKGYTYFETGDVLVAKITPCMENGKAAQVVGLPHRVGFGSTEFHVLRPGGDVDGRYLFQMVWNPFFRRAAAGSMTGSAGQRRVPVSFFARFKIPLPPLSEQRRIAAILDKADAVRRKRQQTLDLADQFLRSAFLEMFGDTVTNPKGWPHVTMERGTGEIVDCPHSTPRWARGGIVCVRTSNLGRGTWLWDDLRYVTREEYSDRSHRGEVLPGDIIVSREGTVGVAAIAPAGMRLCMGQRLIRVRPGPHLTGEYLLRALLRLLSPDVIGRVMVGSTSKHLNVAEFRRMRIPSPPLDLQETYASVADRARGLAQRLKEHEAEEAMLTCSLVQRAFRGDL